MYENSLPAFCYTIIVKRDQETEEQFLLRCYKKMPRTMLRYAIEKFDDKKRKFYLER
ncbi:MAG: DNA alkylation repair protein [Nitrospirae bacterium]|nr:DNA alkylation repair protein [Nitrospirota bacterium]